MMQSCASRRKLRGGGPILQSGLETMGFGRVTTTSDRHRQSVARPAKQLSCCPPSVLLVLLMTPDARRLPVASRLS
jgi:hypothetical protein